MDKLVKLSHKSIPALIDLYKAAGWPKYKGATATFRNILTKTEKYPDRSNQIELLSLNDEWQKDGLFVIRNGPMCYFNCLEDAPYDRVKKALNLIEYKEEIIFPFMHEQFKGIINEIMKEKDLEVTLQTGSSGFLATKKFVDAFPDMP